MINYLSNSIVEGGKAPVFGSPADVGLAYEDVEFEANDGVALRGWLIEGGTDKLIVQSHFGVQCSRSGYTPEGKGRPLMWKEPIAFVGHMRWLVDRGYSVLAYDTRNHGESDAGTTPWVTWGPEERKDVLAAVDFASKHASYPDADIGLLSICMGAASSTYAFGEPGGLGANEQVKAMVAIQPLRYPDFLRALRLDNFIGRRVTRRNNE
ncbi:MAG: alpha/beta fold hydrolase, partial [Actinomycetota bacterium]